MKRSVFLLTMLLFAFAGRAGHILGGEITYEYIGQTGTSHHYRVSMILQRILNAGAPQLSGSYTMNVSSGCFPTQTFTVTRITPPPALDAGDGGFLVQPGTHCVDTVYPGLIEISLHKYEDTVVLPGVCSDFRFYHDVCCRSSIISNIANPSSSTIHLEALLNNTDGPNTSPEFVIAPPMNVSVGQNVVFPVGAMEPDGDSLYFEFSIPQTGVSSYVQYAPGYSANDPIQTVSGINVSGGNWPTHFRPAQVENDVLSFSVTEYRYNTALAGWFPNGKIIREMILNVVPSGINDTVYWAVDSLGIDTTAEIACYGSLIKLHLENEILIYYNSSLDGHFRIVSLTDSVILPVTSAKPIITGHANGVPLSKEIWLYMHKPFTSNDTLLLAFSKNLETSCGSIYPSDTSALLAVESCPTFELTENEQQPGIVLYPNPAGKIFSIEMGDWTFKPLSDIIISDFSGKVVHRERIPSCGDTAVTIDCGHLIAGIYFIRLTPEEGPFHVLWFIKN